MGRFLDFLLGRREHPHGPDPRGERVGTRHTYSDGKLTKEPIYAEDLIAGGTIPEGEMGMGQAVGLWGALQPGKELMARVHTLLEERDEPNVQVTLKGWTDGRHPQHPNRSIRIHHPSGTHELIVIRDGRRGYATLRQDMGANEFINAVIGATSRLRPPLCGSFLGADGMPADIFEHLALAPIDDDEDE